MADIARIGFSAETGPLKDAKASLDALVPSAQKAGQAADDVSRAATNMGSKFQAAAAGTKAAQGSFAAAATGAGMLGRSALMAGTAMGTVQSAAVGANTQINALGATVNRVGTTFVQADSHVEAYRQSLLAIPGAANTAKTSLDRLGAAANDNINQMQSTPGNIAAQFQDIGVTAAGGMSPMLIALQQGTQLSAAFAGGLGNVVAGLRQVFSPVTLLTIAIVGLIAAGIQMVDWGQLAQDTMYFLADAMDVAGVAVLAFGALLLVAFGPQIIAWVAALTVSIGTGLVGAIGTATGALIAFSLANPFTAFVLAIGIVIGALVLLEQKFGGTFTNILSIIKQVANFIISGFAHAFNMVMLQAQGLLNIFVDMYNWTMRISGQANLQADRFSGGMIDPGQDFVGGAINLGRQAASGAADWIRNMAGRMGGGAEAEDEANGRTRRAARGRTPADEPTNDELFAEVIAGAEKQKRALLDANAQIGVYGQALMRLQNEQTLFNDAQDRGVVLTSEMSDELRRLAAEAASLEQSNVVDGFIEDMTRATEDATWALQRERGEIGLVGAALETYRRETELYVAARRAGVPVDEMMIDIIRQQATAYGEMTEAIRLQREELEFNRNTTNTFFGDLVNGLRNGESAWKSFGNAAMSVVNKIIDRLISSGGSGGGLFGMLQGILGIAAPQASLMGSVSSAMAANPAIFAKGGAFDSGGVQKFAKGGAFTNGIYSSPTMFKFAGGGAFGMMGEAGPEAVMPLKRGRDGSLGVQMTGADQRPVVIHVVANDYFDARVEGGAQAVVNRSAGDIARAGADISEQEAMFNSSRRLA